MQAEGQHTATQTAVDIMVTHANLRGEGNTTKQGFSK